MHGLTTATQAARADLFSAEPVYGSATAAQAARADLSTAESMYGSATAAQAARADLSTAESMYGSATAAQAARTDLSTAESMHRSATATQTARANLSTAESTYCYTGSPYAAYPLAGGAKPPSRGGNRGTRRSGCCPCWRSTVEAAPQGLALLAHSSPGAYIPPRPRLPSGCPEGRGPWGPPWLRGI